MESPLVWIDLEMTGLDPGEHVILEIATVVTDAELVILASGPELAIRHDENALGRMDAWNLEHHTQSGLLARVRASTQTTAAAEEQTLEFLSRHCASGTSPLCGNSVWQDRRFLLAYMPKLEGFLHYRNIDVSSIKELARRWYPQLPPFVKAEQHRAAADIEESIQELNYYRQRIFTARSVDAP